MPWAPSECGAEEAGEGGGGGADQGDGGTSGTPEGDIPSDRDTEAWDASEAEGLLELVG